MACYFGCDTKANKIAYIVYFVLVLLGLGLIIGFTDEYVECVEEAQDCGVARGLPDMGVRYFQSYPVDHRVTSDPNAVCHEWYGAGNSSTATNAAADCVFCANKTGLCMAPYGISYGVMLIAGLALFALSLLPCLFCCCCAPVPRDAQPAKTV
eukprot:jgi/Tetstr1/464300/TSEL_009102.t1